MVSNVIEDETDKSNWRYAVERCNDSTDTEGLGSKIKEPSTN